MEEDIKILEENVDYNSLLFGYGNAELSERIRNAIRNLLQAYKEDEAVIEEMSKHIVDSAVVDDTVCGVKFCEVEEDCSYEKMLDCTKEYFRNKVKGEKE